MWRRNGLHMSVSFENALCIVSVSGNKLNTDFSMDKSLPSTSFWMVRMPDRHCESVISFALTAFGSDSFSLFGHSLQLPFTHASFHVNGMAATTLSWLRIVSQTKSRHEVGRRCSHLAFPSILFIAVTIRLALAWTGHVFLSRSRVVGVTAFWGNSLLMVDMAYGHTCYTMVSLGL